MLLNYRQCTLVKTALQSVSHRHQQLFRLVVSTERSLYRQSLTTPVIDTQGHQNIWQARASSDRTGWVENGSPVDTSQRVTLEFFVTQKASYKRRCSDQLCDDVVTNYRLCMSACPEEAYSTKIRATRLHAQRKYLSEMLPVDKTYQRWYPTHYIRSI